MSLVYSRISKEEWRERFSHNARMSVFGEDLDPAVERIDFAYLVADGSTDQLYIYCTFYEMDSTSLYLSFGGAFPDSRGTDKTKEALLGLYKYLGKNGYKTVNYHCKNTNPAMIKLGLKTGAVIVGMSVSPRSILLEHYVDLEKGNK